MFTFDKLWETHPARKGDIYPCSEPSGDPHFANQCAIRMAVCLSASGVDFTKEKLAHCWQHATKDAHVLRAQELAIWMAATPAIFGTVEKKKSVTSSDYKDRKGLVFFMNFWGPGNQGDHIDLWNNSAMTRGDPEYFSLSYEVWFWDIV